MCSCVSASMRNLRGRALGRRAPPVVDAGHVVPPRADVALLLPVTAPARPLGCSEDSPDPAPGPGQRSVKAAQVLLRVTGIEAAAWGVRSVGDRCAPRSEPGPGLGLRSVRPSRGGYVWAGAARRAATMPQNPTVTERSGAGRVRPFGAPS